MAASGHWALSKHICVPATTEVNTLLAWYVPLFNWYVYDELPPVAVAVIEVVPPVEIIVPDVNDNDITVG